MLYPLKFTPVYKDYIWGGRSFEKLGKVLPEGIVAESWEISCHPDGVSVISNGEFKGTLLPDLLKMYGRQIVGTDLPEKDMVKFPLLVKFIDANEDLSVQVHPGDAYATVHENGEYGKNEAWYVISANPGSKLIYDVSPGIDRETFAQAVRDDNIESCLKSVEVFPGDVINIPAGLIHALGKGIMLAEVQQNSNTTYRVYDYNRTDKYGNKRPLHIEKALDVIDFNSAGRREKSGGLEIRLDSGSSSTYVVANRYFTIELYDVKGRMNEIADGGRFHIYVFTAGEGEIRYGTGSTGIKGGESILVPASMGNYTINGKFKAIKSYVPDLKQNVFTPLKNAGYSEEEIYAGISGLAETACNYF